MTEAINQLIKDNQWQDIKDAPQDNKPLLLKNGDEQAVGWSESSDNQFYYSDCCGCSSDFTHFRPPPDDRLAKVCEVLLKAVTDIKAHQEWLGASLSGLSATVHIADKALLSANEIAKGNSDEPCQA